VSSAGAHSVWYASILHCIDGGAEFGRLSQARYWKGMIMSKASAWAQAAATRHSYGNTIDRPMFRDGSGRLIASIEWEAPERAKFQPIPLLQVRRALLEEKDVLALGRWIAEIFEAIAETT
jgi:hypothetical protein